MPDLTLLAALTIAALTAGVIVHMAHQLHRARRRIAAQTEALRLQALDEGIRPHLRMVGPPTQLSWVDWCRMHFRRPRVGTVAAAAAVGIAVAILWPEDSTTADVTAPDPLPAQRGADKINPRTTTPADTSSTPSPRTTTPRVRTRRDFYASTPSSSPTMTTAARPRNAAASPEPRPSTSAEHGANTCLVSIAPPCGVVAKLLAS